MVRIREEDARKLDASLARNDAAPEGRVETLPAGLAASRVSARAQPTTSPAAGSSGKGPRPRGLTVSSAPIRRPMSWARRFGIFVVGFAWTLGLFLFLGTLQPALDGKERISLPQVLAMKLKAPPKKSKLTSDRKEKKKAPPKRRKRPTSSDQKKVRTTRKMKSVARKVANPIKSLAPVGDFGGSDLGVEIPTGGDLGGADVFSVESNQTLTAMSEMTRRRQQTLQRESRMRSSFGSSGFDSITESNAAREAQTIDTPSPEYPPEAAEKGETVVVRLKVLVSPNGTVDDVKYEPGTALYYRREIDKVLPLWQFQPALDENDQPVSEEVPIQFTFGPRE